MRKLLMSITLVLSAMSAGAKAPWANAEHILYVKIETEPRDAAVHVVSARDSSVNASIGHTPLVIPIEMNWGRRVLMKSWPKLTVSTTSGIATNEYDSTTKEHIVSLTFALEKPGYIRQVVQPVVAVLQRNDSAEDWDHMISLLPETQPIKIKLTLDTNSLFSAAKTPSRATSPQTVMLASGGSINTADIGTLLIESPFGAPAYVDGIPAGSVPLRIILPAGPHWVSTVQNGKQTAPLSVAIEAGKVSNAILTIPTSK